MGVRRCGVCGRQREIVLAARDGRPDTCDSCWRPPTTTCSVCRRRRPCLFADSPSPVCESCRQRTAFVPEPCIVCRESRRVVWRTEAGPVCERCRDRHLRTQTACSRCGHQRRPVLPIGAPLCTSCAGVQADQRCGACGAEAAREEGDRCARCALSARLDALRAQADSAAIAALERYLRALQASPQPASALKWVRHGRGYRIVEQLARGELALTHQALDELHGDRRTSAITFLRPALVAHGALPARDEQLARLERWATAHVRQLPDGEDRGHLRAFTRWRLLADLARRYPDHDTPAAAAATTRTKILRAIDLVGWLHDRGLRLRDLRQDLLDEFVLAGTTPRRKVDTFVAYLATSGVCPALAVPRAAVLEPTIPLTDTHRLRLANNLLTNTALDPAIRLAACLVLFYAQPVTRIARLRTDDLDDHDGQLTLRLGAGHVVLAAPIADLARRLLAADRRGQANTAAPATSPWLFPGGRVDAPIAEHRLAARLRQLGVPARAGRAAALQHLLHQLPATVLAEQLGYSPWIAEKWSRASAADYARYIARRPQPRPAGQPSSAGQP